MTDITQGTFATPTAEVRDRYEPVNGAGAQVGNDLARGFEDASKAYIKYKTDQQTALATAAVEGGSQQILTGVAAYDQRLRHINEAMMSASPEQAKQLQAEVQRIKDGQDQGVISPSAAILQYHNIAKNYGNNPLIASAARQYVASFTGELGAIVSADDKMTPTEEGHAKLAERAAESMRTPQEQLQFEQEKETAAKAAQDYTVGLQNGVKFQSDVEYAFGHPGDRTSPVGKLVAGLQPAMVTDLVNSAMIASNKGAKMEDQIRNVEMRKQADMDGLRTMLQAIHSDPKSIGVNGPVIFDVQKVIDEMSKPYDDLLTVLGKTDRTDEMKRISDAGWAITQNEGNQQLMGAVGPLGFVSVTHASDPVKALNDVYGFAKMMVSGQGGELEAAKKSNPGLRILLDGLGNGNLLGTLGKDLIEQLHGRVPTDPPRGTDTPRAAAALPPEVQARLDKASYGVVSSEPDVNKKMDLLSNIINSNHPLEGAVAALRDITPILQKSKPARDALDNRYNQSINYVLNQLGAADAGKIRYTNGTWQVDPSVRITAPLDVYGGEGNWGNTLLGPGQRGTANMNSTQVEGYLNRMETIRSAYLTDHKAAHQWVADSFAQKLQRMGGEAEQSAQAARDAGITGTYYMMADASGAQVLAKDNKPIDPNTPVGKSDALKIAKQWEQTNPAAALAVYSEFNKKGIFDSKIKQLTQIIQPEG